MCCAARLSFSFVGGDAVVVEVEGRGVGQGQDLPGDRIHHDDGAAVGVVLLDRLGQHALGDELQVAVDRRLDGRARHRGAQEPREQARMARQRRLHHQLQARLAGEDLLHRQLDAGLALVVDVGVADQVRRGDPTGVGALRHFDDAHVRLVERPQRHRLVVRKLAPEEHVARAPLFPAQLPDQGLAIGGVAIVQEAAQARRRPLGIVDERARRFEGVAGHRHRQRAAVAGRDFAARRRDQLP